MFDVRQLTKWATEPVESTLAQVPRALAVSVLALALDCGLLVLLVEGLGLPAVPAAVLSYLVGGVVQYVLCSVWVFAATPGSNAVGFAAFTLLSLVGLGITWVVMLVLHDWGHMPYLAAKGFGVGLAFAWNFLSRKYLLFSPAPALPEGKTPAEVPA